MTVVTRLIDPPRSVFDRLPTSLTDGERQVIDLFDRHLDPTWEMYVQPHLNGLRPDLVLLNPRIGIAVFEIKDWDLSAMRYFVSGSDLRAKRDGKNFPVENPINKIRLYENEIFELYCPRLDARAGRAVITAGLVFTKTPRPQVIKLLGQLRDKAMQEYPRYYPIAGSDDLERSSLDQIFPERTRQRSKYMDPDKAEDLRGWLREPAFSKEQRHRPIPLSSPQRNLVVTRTGSGYRRIRGPAGSGKSVVAACRAAELARQGNSVLVVCYNITLLNYLRDLAVRHVAEPPQIRRGVDFLNFHLWCKRICKIGNPEAYSKSWRNQFDDRGLSSTLGGNHEPQSAIDGIVTVEENQDDQDDQDPQQALDKVVELVDELYREKPIDLPTYDAILVDEGQDFRPRWWDVLRHALKPDGEMVLVADKTQDIYGTASSWTDATMEGCGFTGPWSELKESYRLPGPVIPLVRKFAENFLAGEVDLPLPVQMELDIDESRLRWVHVENKELAAQACLDELKRMMTVLPENTAVADLTFICVNKVIGRDVVDGLEDKGVRVRHTFAEDGRTTQRQKRAFFQGDARVKATTIHSYKGWEGKLLVVFVDSIDGVGGELLYTAMTRLRRGTGAPSSLTVVSTCAGLRGFAKEWPEYEEYLN